MYKQKTIKKKILIEGRSLYDNKIVSVMLVPNYNGLYVCYGKEKRKLNYKLIKKNNKEHVTSILIGKSEIRMTEHLFSALNAFEIDNLLIIFNNLEVPFYANSNYFVKKIINSGIKKLTKKKSVKIVKRNYILKGTGEQQLCLITPSKKTEYVISIDFPKPIGKQSFYYEQKDINYVENISYARSFLMFKLEKDNVWKNHKIQFNEMPKLLKNRSYEECPFIAYYKDSFVKPLKDNMEPVRHKMLDLIGDLFYLRDKLQGRIYIHRPGHSFNAKIVEFIEKKIK